MSSTDTYEVDPLDRIDRSIDADAETVISEPPTRLVFRWHHALPDGGIDRSARVEFTIDD